MLAECSLSQGRAARQNYHIRQLNYLTRQAESCSLFTLLRSIKCISWSWSGLVDGGGEDANSVWIGVLEVDEMG
jgi:hypothetical protein